MNKKMMDFYVHRPQLHDKGIQNQISNTVLGYPKRFSRMNLSETDAVTSWVDERGVTQAINEATRQSDIMNELQKQETTKLISHFTDEETEEVIEITDDLRQRAYEVQGFIKGSFFLLAEGLAAMADEKLYGVFGYSSFSQYCRNELSFGVRQAYNYAVIGRKIGHYAQLSDGKGAKSISHLEDIGTTKLSEIIKRAEDQVGRLISDGKIQIGDEEITSDQIAEKTVRQLREELKNTQEKAAKAEELEYKTKLLKKENEDLQEDNKRLLKNQEHIKKQNEIKEAIRQVDQHVTDALALLGAIDLDEADEKTARDHVTYVNNISDRLIAHREEHLGLFEAYGDEDLL